MSHGRHVGRMERHTSPRGHASATVATSLAASADRSGTAEVATSASSSQTAGLPCAVTSDDVTSDDVAFNDTSERGSRPMIGVWSAFRWLLFIYVFVYPTIYSHSGCSAFVTQVVTSAEGAEDEVSISLL